MENYISTNIADENLYKEKASETLNKISQCLEKSLGYYGSSTIIEDKICGHIITKDGYTILQNLKFDNPISCTIYDIIKKISFELVQEVGDGSTSSIVIANSLFDEIKKSEILNKYSAKAILDCLKDIEKILIHSIENIAIPINEDNFDVVEKIATISNNNDNEVGKNIYNIYKQIGLEGFVYLEESYDTEDHVEFVKGIEINRGMIADDFANQKNKIEAKFKDPFIFMCNDRLDSSDLTYIVDVIGNLVSRHAKPVVMIAKSFSAEFVNCWIINKKNNPKLDICLIDFSFANAMQKGMFEDIAIYTGTTIYDKEGSTDIKDIENIYSMLGSCEQMSVNNRTTKIIGCKAEQKDIDERIETITEQIAELKRIDAVKNESFIFSLESRRANLKSLIVRYLVGGNSEIEKSNRKYLIEDSVFACRSALRSGYVIGGNLTIPKIISKNIDDISNAESEYNIGRLDDLYHTLINCLYQAFISCYMKVLSNKFVDSEKVSEIINDIIVESNDDIIYNIKNDKYENINNTNVVNSAMTEIKILESTISIIGLLVTSNQFISKTLFD